MRNLNLHIIIVLSVILSTATAQNLDSLKLALKNAKHDTTRCNILNAMIEAESDNAVWPNYNEQLKTIAERNLEILKPNHPNTVIFKKYLANSLNNIGYIYDNQGDYQKALDYYTRSLKIFEERKDKKEIQSELINIGVIYYKKADYSKALEYYFKSFKIQNELGDKEGIAITLNNIGAIYNDQGDIYKALNYHKRSLKIREELADKEGIAQSLNHLGSLYKDQNDTIKALEYYERSLKIREEIEDKEGIANTLSNIGYIYEIQGNFQKALEYYERSLKIREEIGHYEGIANSLHLIGNYFREQGDITRALEYYNNALIIIKKIGNKKMMAFILTNLGGLYLEQKNYLKALDYTSSSMKISKEIGVPVTIRNAAERLSIIYKAIGNHKLAFENYELFIRMRDSINNIETQKATIKQQTQYEYDKKKAVEDEKHAAELKVQDEKAQADQKRQNIIIGSVSVVLLLVGVFSILLYNRFKTTQKQKQIIEIKEKETQAQKHIIEEKQKEILDSINYAKRIQYTLLAHEEFLKENLPEHFTYFNPKDIVSGDFYWATKYNKKFYLAVCDSTGHGVPGAFMSLLNISFLNEAVNEKGIEAPNKIFDFVRQRLIDNISKEGQKDGFDGILICIDKSKNKITYAAANNAPILIKNEAVAELLEADSDRMPVGMGERKENFKLFTIEANAGDTLYLYTDGYADQFGGPKGKKFKYKALNELLLATSAKSLSEQKEILKNTFENWRGELEQVDDVCVIGIKF